MIADGIVASAEDNPLELRHIVVARQVSNHSAREYSRSHARTSPQVIDRGRGRDVQQIFSARSKSTPELLSRSETRPQGMPTAFFATGFLPT